MANAWIIIEYQPKILMRTFLISVNKSEVLNAMCTFEQFWENMTYGERANTIFIIGFFQAPRLATMGK